jgi:hypothetical protein
VRIVHSGAAESETLALADTLPAGLTYVAGTLRASSGVANDLQANLLRWSGAPLTNGVVTITYDVIIAAGVSGPITNRAVISGSQAGPLSLNATLLVNASGVYLPFVGNPQE